MFENFCGFRGRCLSTVFLAIVVSCFVSASCGGTVTTTGNGSGAVTPSGAACSPYGFATASGTPSPTTTSPPTTRRGAICLTAQSFSGTSSVTLDFQGFRDSTAVCIPDGAFTFSTQAFDPVNNTCAGPVSPPSTINFALDYVGDLRRNPVCVQSSRVDFRSFVATGTPLDTTLAGLARDSILAELDFEVTNSFNRTPLGSGTAIDRNNVRCPGWSLIPTTPTPVPPS